MNTNAKKKITNLYHVDDEDPKKKRLVCSIDKKKKNIEYFLAPHCPQYRWIQKITIQGFTRLPAGFKKNGTGFPRGGGYLIPRYLSEKFDGFELIISISGKNRIRKVQNKHVVTLNYLDFRKILRIFRSITQEKYNLIQISAKNFLSKNFPKKFKEVISNGLTYKENQFRDLLDKEDIIKNLSNQDIEKLIEFFPSFIKYYGHRLKGRKRLLGISKSKDVTETVYLESVINEFEKKLKAKTHNEHRWQKFLREYILIFNSNYTAVLEKKSLTLSGKYPDFLLVDVYNYLDIYEIKKPNTLLLKFDKSRNNYYWSSELSKAISQVENYIDSANKNSLLLKEEIKKKEKIEIRVVKPRGFIIAGLGEQLKDEITEDNFRLLNNSLKNVEIILYDELLQNMKNFLQRLNRN